MLIGGSNFEIEQHRVCAAVGVARVFEHALDLIHFESPARSSLVLCVEFCRIQQETSHQKAQ